MNTEQEIEADEINDIERLRQKIIGFAEEETKVQTSLNFLFEWKA